MENTSKTSVAPSIRDERNYVYATSSKVSISVFKFLATSSYEYYAMTDIHTCVFSRIARGKNGFSIRLRKTRAVAAIHRLEPPTLVRDNKKTRLPRNLALRRTNKHSCGMYKSVNRVAARTLEPIRKHKASEKKQKSDPRKQKTRPWVTP